MKRIKTHLRNQMVKLLVSSVDSLMQEFDTLFTSYEIPESIRIQLISFCQTQDKAVLRNIAHCALTNSLSHTKESINKLCLLLILSAFITRLTPLSNPDRLSPLIMTTGLFGKVMLDSEDITHQKLLKALAEVREELHQMQQLVKERGGNPNNIIEA